MTTNKVWTRDEIATKLTTDVKWLVRGIVAIYEKQTSDEQNSETTKHHNAVGFNGRDAKFGSSLAQQLQNGRHLSYRQIDAAQRMMVKYAGQLAKIANGEI